MQANTIDEVILILDEIIEENKEKNNPAGYFAALYRKVTQSVKEGISNGEFEDGERMERLDVIFANRYLEAHEQYNKGQSLSKSWQIAFDKSTSYWPNWPIVLQHLLWGINAHINLDLGIAASETILEESLDSLEQDFDKINEVLANLVEELEKELSEISPMLKYILTFSGRVDNFFVNFSLKKARDGAWKFANELHAVNKEDKEQMIWVRDKKIAKIASYISPSGIIPNIVFRAIRIREKGTVKIKIEILE